MKNEQNLSLADSSKRKIFKGALIGGAAAVWYKPVVNSVLLPAHAQMTTTQQPPSFFAASATPTIVMNSPLDFIIPQAYAGSEESTDWHIEAIYVEDNVYDVTVMLGYPRQSMIEGQPESAESEKIAEIFDYREQWSDQLTLSQQQQMSYTGCQIRKNGSPDGTATITSLSESSMVLEFYFNGSPLVFNVSPGGGSLPQLYCEST